MKLFREEFKDRSVTELISLELLHVAKETRDYVVRAGEEGFDFKVIIRRISQSPMLIFIYLNHQPEGVVRLDIKDFYKVFSPDRQTIDDYQSALQWLSAEDRDRLGAYSLEQITRECLVAVVHLYFLILSKGRGKDLDSMAKELQPAILTFLERTYDFGREVNFTQVLAKAVTLALENLEKRLHHHAVHGLGFRGIMKFLDGIIDEFTIDDLIEQGRGIRGSHLILLRMHLDATAEIAMRLCEKLLRESDVGLKAGISPYDAYICGIFHDLGQSLLMKFYPQIHRKIWDQMALRFELLQNNGEKELPDELKTYWQIERRVIREHQTLHVTSVIEKLNPLLSLHHHELVMGRLTEMPDTLAKKIRKTIKTLIIVKRESDFDHTIYAREWAPLMAELYLWCWQIPEDKENPEVKKDILFFFKQWFAAAGHKMNLTPMRHNGELSHEVILAYSRDRSYSGQALSSYAEFVAHFHDWEKCDSKDPMIPLIRLCNELTANVSGASYSLPVVFSNALDGEPLGQGRPEIYYLAHHLAIPANRVEKLAQDTAKEYAEAHAEDAVPISPRTVRTCPLYKPEQLVQDLEYKIGQFFLDSSLFDRGVRLFYDLDARLKRILNSPDASADLFFRSMELELMSLLQIEEVRCIANVRGNDTYLENELSLFKKKMSQGRGKVVETFKHSIASFYLIDSKPDVVGSPEVKRFLRLLCEFLQLNYDSELSEILKHESEHSRFDVLKEIGSKYHLEGTLEYQFLKIKVLVLNKLVEEAYEPESEMGKLFLVQFVRLHAAGKAPSISLYPTEDFTYWRNRARKESFQVMDDEEYRRKLVKGLECYADLLDYRFNEERNLDEAVELQVDFMGKRVPVLVRRLCSPADSTENHDCLILFGRFRIAETGQALQELLAAQDLYALTEAVDARRALPCMRLLELYSSEKSVSSLKYLTGLYEGDKRMNGDLIETAWTEVYHLLPSLPKRMSSLLENTFEQCRQIYAESKNHFLSQRIANDSEKSKIFAIAQRFDNLSHTIKTSVRDLIDLMEQDLLSTNIPGFSHQHIQIHLDHRGSRMFRTPKSLNRLKAQLRDMEAGGKTDLRGRELIEDIERLTGAWLIADQSYLKEALRNLLTGLGQLGLKMPRQPQLSVTIFAYQGEMPHQRGRHHHVGMELYLAADDSGNIDCGDKAFHNKLVKPLFTSLCYVGHRWVSLNEENQTPMMRMEIAGEGEWQTATRSVDADVYEKRFLRTPGSSLLLFFPCKHTVRERRRVELDF